MSFGEDCEPLDRHDVVNDPFYNLYQQGKWANREVKMAKTFLKPLAYYNKRDDHSAARIARLVGPKRAWKRPKISEEEVHRAVFA